MFQQLKDQQTGLRSSTIARLKSWQNRTMFQPRGPQSRASSRVKPSPRPSACKPALPSPAFVNNQTLPCPPKHALNSSMVLNAVPRFLSLSAATSDQGPARVKHPCGDSYRGSVTGQRPRLGRNTGTYKIPTPQYQHHNSLLFLEKVPSTCRML